MARRPRYTLGHFSKFVLAGARRVYSSNPSGVVGVAFVNPDGSKALVAYNDTKTSKTFQVRWGAQTFGYTLAGLSGATFTWSGTQSGGYTLCAATQIQASSFNDTRGLQTEVTADVVGGYNVGYADDGDYAVYKSVTFPAGPTAVIARCRFTVGGDAVAICGREPAPSTAAVLNIKYRF